MATNPSDFVTLGGGKMYIDPFVNGKPSGKWQYFGLTTSPSVSIDMETMEHINTEGPTQAVDKTIVKKQSGTMSWSSDQIDMQMLSRAFFGEVTALSGDKTITAENVAVGDFIDVGAIGGSVSITSDSVDLEADTDYKYDTKTGMIEIIDDSNISGGAIEVSVSGADNAEAVEAFKNTKLEAALMFVGDTATGTAIKVEFFKCSIRQDGEFALKGDDWLNIGFVCDILKDETKDANAGSQFFKITKLAVN